MAGKGAHGVCAMRHQILQATRRATNEIGEQTATAGRFPRLLGYPHLLAKHYHRATSHTGSAMGVLPRGVF